MKTNGLTLQQKIIISVLAGAMVGLVSAMVSHHAAEHFIKKNGRSLK